MNNILFLDIESSNLSADIGKLYLIGCKLSNKYYFFYAEKEIVALRAFCNFLNERYDDIERIFTFFGNSVKGFDLRFIKAKFFKYRISTGKYFKEVDLYENTLKMSISSRSLNRVNTLIDEKKHKKGVDFTDFDIEDMITYNKQDLKLLENLYRLMIHEKFKERVILL